MSHREKLISMLILNHNKIFFKKSFKIVVKDLAFVFACGPKVGLVIGALLPYKWDKFPYIGAIGLYKVSENNA